MLKLMRDNFQQLKWALLAVVAAFVIGFVYVDMGLGGPRVQKEDRAYAARVNGETIAFREYDRALYYTQKNYEQMYRQPLTAEMVQAMNLPQQVLDGLVDQRLLLQQAYKLHLNATPAEVRKRILEIPTLNPNGRFVGQELYARWVTGQLGYQSTAEFEDEMAKEITLRKIDSAMTSSIVISPKAADEEYKRVTENAKIKYVLLATAREAAAVTVTPAEVDQYYKANQANYAHGEQRALKYLLADQNRLRSQIIPTDAELKKRYDASKEDYKRPESAHILHILIKVDINATPDQDAGAKAKAENIVKQLRDGADFGKLAKENSGDPSSAGKGGDMGFVDRGMTVDPFDQAAFSIPMNTISDPIRSKEFGYHIIKVLERKPGGYRPFEEVRPMLSAQLSDQMSKDQARDEITKISARLKQSKPKTPAEFAALANDRVSSNDTQWFAKNDPIPGMGNNPAVAAWAFSAKQGDVGEIIGTQRGPAIPYLYAIRPGGVAELTEIRAKVEADARSAKARQAAQQKLAQALPAANIDEVAKKAGQTALETMVTRQGYVSGFSGDTTALVDAAMSAKVGEMKGPIVMSDGAVVLQVIEQKKVDPKAVDESRGQYAEMLRQQQARNLRTVLLQRLRKASKIEINPVVMQRNAPPQQAGL
ncbi:MAG TPA: peptidyl-prolyl cis-trans isomerase [Thermoanaerobaculia bacterium]|nr:peptidyl-prolyl cis-trans isomerase [Thermoanaerobaculia bacterium]